MAKLKERQFYNVGLGKKEMVPAEYIEVVKFKNGTTPPELINVSFKEDTSYHRGFRLNNNILFRDMTLNTKKYYSEVEELTENNKKLYIDTINTPYKSDRGLPILYKTAVQSEKTDDAYGKEGTLWKKNCLLVQSKEKFNVLSIDYEEAEVLFYDLGPNKLDDKIEAIYEEQGNNYANEMGKNLSIQQLIENNTFSIKFGIDLLGNSSSSTTINQWQNGTLLSSNRKVGQFGDNNSIFFSTKGLFESAVKTYNGLDNIENPIDLIDYIATPPVYKSSSTLVCRNSKYYN